MDGLREHLPDVVPDILLLLVRVIIGVAFAGSARKKFTDIPKFAGANGLPVPVAYCVATAELLGATGVLLGVLTPLPAICLMLLMIATTSIHIFKWHSPYWASEGGWEYDLILFTLAGVLAIFGAGAFSFDGLF